MDGQQFIEEAQEAIANLFPGTKPSDWYAVWQVKVLQNNKAMLSTDVIDGKYIEVTYNGDEREMYVDTYSHSSNDVVSM